MGWLVWEFSIGVGEIFCTSPDCDPPSLLCNRYRVSFWVVKQPVLNLHGLHPQHLSLYTLLHTHSLLLLLFFILLITLYTLLHIHSLLLLFSLFFPPHLSLHTLFTPFFRASSILLFLFTDNLCRQCMQSDIYGVSGKSLEAQIKQ